MSSTANPLAVFEHSYYIGNYMSAILYGAQLVLYFLTLRAIMRRGPVNGLNSRTKKITYIVFTTVMLLLLTIDISVNAVWGEQMWITFRDSAGGVVGFIVAETSVWYQTLGSTSVVAMIFIGDALLLHRLHVMYPNYLVMIVPILAYFSAFALAIIELILAGKPNGNFFGGKAINFGTPYYAITIGLNILITILICVRIIRLSKAVDEVLGHENSKPYTAVVAMLVESAAPYSIVGVMFLIPYACGSQLAISFGQVWAKLACISPQLILLRVVNGTAWETDVITRAETYIEFADTNTESKRYSAHSSLRETP